MFTGSTSYSKLRYCTLATGLVAISAFAGQASAATLLFDFGRGGVDYETAGNWNNIVGLGEADSGGTGMRITDAVDSDGNQTVVDLNLTEDFDGMGSGGVAASDVYPQTAQVDYFQFARDGENATPQVRLENLTVGETYDLTFFGSRSGGLNRVLTITIDGHDPVTVTNSNNTSDTATIAGVSPDANGHITVDFSTTTSYAYLGVIEVEGNYAPIPEPASLGLVGVGSLLLLTRRRK